MLRRAKTAPFAQNEAKIRSRKGRALTSPKGGYMNGDPGIRGEAPPRPYLPAAYPRVIDGLGAAVLFWAVTPASSRPRCRQDDGAPNRTVQGGGGPKLGQPRAKRLPISSVVIDGVED